LPGFALSVVSKWAQESLRSRLRLFLIPGIRLR
jgi:hypothetical protein